MTNLFRISYSILDPWSKGNYDESIRRYLRIPTPPTPQMEEGKLFHEQWHSETLRTNKLPVVFGGGELVKPQCELKLECVLDEWIQFVGVVDCLEESIIREYKTGKANSVVYANAMQVPCYQVLVEEHGYKPKEAHIHHFNQHAKKVTHSKIYLSEETKAKGREWIVTYSSELRSALEGTGVKV